MQAVNSALQTELDKGLGSPVVLVDLFEFYAADEVPGATGFDPADAIETFAAQEITWNSIAYRREVINRSDIIKSITEKINSVTLTFSNISRYLATLAQSQDMEGMIVVIRCVAPSVTDDSLVLFTGRCGKPSDIDKQTFSITATQDFGNINITIPPNKFESDDPEGRLPSDPEFEGIPFNAIGGSLTFPQVVPATSFFGRLFGRRKTVQTTAQWSSTDNTPYGQVIRECFGRTQVELIIFNWADKGTHVGYLAAVSRGPVAAITNIKSRTEGLSDPVCNFANPPAPAVTHLGNVGTANGAATCQSDLARGLYFSKLAYIEGAAIGFQNGQIVPLGLDEQDTPPVLTAIVRGRKMPVRNSSGVYGGEEWSNNPVDILRFIMTDSKFVNVDEAFMDDAVLHLTAQHCDAPILDDSGSQIIVIPSIEEPIAGDAFSRYRATGIYTPRYFLYNNLGDGSLIPEFVDGPYIGIDQGGSLPDPSVSTDPTFLSQKPLIKRYTFNSTISEEVRATDFINKTLLPSFKGFLRVNKNGKIEIRSEVSSDSTRLRTATAVGATSIPVLDVTPWKTGPELLKGRVLLGFGLTTSEVRTPSAADYSTSGNAITLTASGSGTVTATASGATLSGGSTSVPATGTITIGGGSTVPAGVSYQNDFGMTTGAGGAITVTSGGWGNSGAATVASIALADDGQFGGVLGLGTIVLGLGYSDSPTTNTDLEYGLQLNGPSGIASLIISGAAPVALIPCSPGDRFDVIKQDGVIRFTKNGAIINTGSIAIPAVTGTLYGNVVGFTNGANLTSAEMGTADVAGGTVNIAIGGIAVSYEFGADVIEGIAAMIAAYINANQRLNKFIRATWDSSNPEVITITCLHGALTVPALLKAHTTALADPTSAPTAAGSSGGSLPAGTYFLAYSDVNAIGETYLTASASVVVTANQKIDVSSIAALVGTSRNYYLSESAGSTNLRFVANRTNNTNFSITDVPEVGAAQSPTWNQTAEELLRVAKSFATNSQDIYPEWKASFGVTMSDTYLPTVLNGHKYQVTTAGTTGTTEPTWPTTAGGTVASGTAVFTETGSTVLAQAGLSRSNVIKNSFKWPLGSRQSTVNQIKTAYRSAKDDFALQPLTVNDYTHQAYVKKKYPLEIDLSGVDNFNQAKRLCNFNLSKYREGDHFHALGTGPSGLVLEEGDVICTSDDSGGLINVVTRIEELRITKDHDVYITQARRYSTLMFSDDVGSHRIPLASTLRFAATKDTLAEFIDTIAIRDSDAMVPGFKIALSHDLAVEGDWRGASVWADFGDGYKFLKKHDVAATIGTCDTTLGAVSDIEVFDEINTVDFTLDYEDGQFGDDMTEAELLANPYRRLFLIGDEYVQAGTNVSNGSRSYTESDFLRGRFETDDDVIHSASERVVYMNGAEIFVELPISQVGIPFNIKVVTTNQDVADATAIPFTWAGNNVRPRKITEIYIAKDGSNDWLIQFLGHPRPFEMPAEYVVEIWEDHTRNDPTKLKRRLPVTEGTTHACLLNSSGSTYVQEDDPEGVPGGLIRVEDTHADKNNLHGDGIADVNGQTLEDIKNTFTRFSFTLAIEDSGTGIGKSVSAGLISEDGVTTPPTFNTSLSPAVVRLSDDTGTVNEIVSTYGTTVSSSTLGSGGDISQRYAIILSGTEYRVYRDYEAAGGQVPLAIIPAPSAGFPFPLRLKMNIDQINGDEVHVTNVTAGGALRPTTIYSLAEQLEDFGVEQSMLFLRIYQKGRYADIGDPVDF